ncbi:MAG: UDP-glucose/GDP-mannose dehydrogenase family protein [Bdellovibrionota bacterium]
MNITIIGTGYVGLVTGACFAETGNKVSCVDVDVSKVQKLQASKIPFFEPGLAELVARNIEQGRLTFSTDMTSTKDHTDVYFVCVGTPSRADGAANLDYVYQCIDQIADLTDETIVVVKSTVPIGTNAKLRFYLDQKGKDKIHLVSNPEFLREGTAVEDSLKPDRVVIGARGDKVAEKMHALYKPFFLRSERIFMMSPESAELTKYAANCYLATRITYMNEISQLCEEMDADVNQVRQAMGADHRIGPQYLYPSVGIGGSCFPKDLRAMKSVYDEKGLRPEILTAVLQTNHNQKNRFFQKICKHFGGESYLSGKVFAIWGTAFKANTDDIRESAALDIIRKLLDAHAKVRVFDPEAGKNTQAVFGDAIEIASDIYSASEKADAICIMTEWNQFRSPDFQKLRSSMHTPLIFDGRNLYSREQMQSLEMQYYSIGRQPVLP